MASKPTSSSSASRRTKDAAYQETVVGSFRRMEEIGRGSFATVYKASMSKKPGYVAIKSVDLNKLNKKLKENLYSEIHILKGLHHPHIVALIDCQETSAHIHLIMEFCELGDLSYFIKKRDTLSKHPTTAGMIRKYPNPAAGGLNEVIVRHFLKQLSSALQFLRAKNFIHRDVKPQNLLLDPSPQYYRTVKPEHIPFAAHDRSLTPIVGIESLPTLKIADFGFARSLPSTSLAETLCGSPLYMAPEILRYEKYDAKADLWSVGTVLYEMMVGKPPFRASNHVELLRKIERGEDRIRFPEEVCLSDSMKRVIRGLLKRNPVERMGFEDFFNNTVVKDEIPGLVEEDKPARPLRSDAEHPADGRRATDVGKGGTDTVKSEGNGKRPQSSREQSSTSPKSSSPRVESSTPRHGGGTPPRAGPSEAKETKIRNEKTRPDQAEVAGQVRRPSIKSHATAPPREDHYSQAAKQAATTPIGQRRLSKQSPSGSPTTRERALQKEQTREFREVQERAAQEVAFERDYVVVDKRNVEVNAFADELAASPRFLPSGQPQNTAHRGALIRRATTQGPPNSTIGAQASPSKAIQVATSKDPDQAHYRRGSYERRLREGPSATSAISKAINLASGRLFNLGFSPPLGSGRPIPPATSYSPFPAYPINSGSVLMLQDGSRAPVPLDEDARSAQAIEDSATRSNVVYGFAEIKLQQLIPAAPSSEGGPEPQAADIKLEKTSARDIDLDLGATVTCAEEALVLYVKALSLLARSMNIAGAWWAQKNKGDVTNESRSSGSTTSTNTKPISAVAVGSRVNSVVQWVRQRFNEVLEKAEFVRLKLINAQNQLPLDHPNHPSSQTSASNSAAAGSAASGDVTVTSGVTAEKLMYDYALEKSRSAAVNELVGENLPGCELDYMTAIWLLEAILEDDEDITATPKGTATEKESEASHERTSCVEADDRQVVLKLVHSIRTRHAALQKKIRVQSRRSSMSNQVPVAASRSPGIATTPPR